MGNFQSGLLGVVETSRVPLCVIHTDLEWMIANTVCPFPGLG